MRTRAEKEAFVRDVILQGPINSNEQVEEQVQRIVHAWITDVNNEILDCGCEIL